MCTLVAPLASKVQRRAVGPEPHLCRLHWQKLETSRMGSGLINQRGDLDLYLPTCQCPYLEDEKTRPPRLAGVLSPFIDSASTNGVFALSEALCSGVEPLSGQSQEK